ncbi:MAG: hypothetical protein KatS3mg090_0035 [Patescibacteria group bacterium]|nr:MAG: hypothetical protein KatS3mg090_0035 [Patescibacteria group bacterium]
MKTVFAYGFSLFLATIILVVFISGFFPAKYFFPYRDVLLGYSSASWSAFGNFDGVHYIKIARDGYDNFQQAFFPLYPLLIRLVAPFFGGNYLTAGLFISWISFFSGIWVWFQVGKTLGFADVKVKKTLLLWMFFPTAYYFFCLYTESLFFCLLGFSVYFLLQKKVWQLFIVSFFLSLTRVVGLFFPVVVFFDPDLSLRKKIFASLGSFLGIGIFCLYLFKTTGDPFYFITAQKAFNSRQVDSWVFLPQVYYRYFKIFVTADFSFAYFIAVLEFLFFSFAFLILIIYGFKKDLFYFYKKFSIEKGLFFYSLIVLLLPTLTGSFYSLPRFVLLIPSVMIYQADLLSKKFYLYNLISVLYLVLYSVLLIAFANGYFVA